MVLNPKLMLTSLKMSVITMLFISIFFFTKSYTYNLNTNKTHHSSTTGITTKTNHKQKTTTYKSGPFSMKMLKFLTLLSSLSLALFMYLDSQTTKMMFSVWLFKTTMKVSLDFLYDKYFLMFFTTALFVTWSIMEFSYYYMKEDPKKTLFFRLLIIFLLKMLMLTCSKSLFLIFLGWEGVGFLSFLLMSWWTTRKDAKSSALEAVMYNRMGDIGLMTFMALSMPLFNSWKLSEMLSSKMQNQHLLPFLLFGILLAASGKSAQFGLHPWLPAAMEGPTPVSALLHSSTMVVAGVFLLMRTSELFKTNPLFQTMMLLLGGMTALFAATTAMSQYDMKKMMAYSTTSQLGLMVTAMGLNQPLYAFFHVCTHAFFKAMLFLCSGSIMHSLKDEQDIRKMSKLNLLLPITSSCLTLGSLALMGTPFLAGFYSKDLILEAASASLLNFLGLTLALIATLLTAVYSFRMIYFCFLSNPSTKSLSPMKEENNNLSNSLIRLAMGTITSGWFFSNFMFTSQSFTLPNLSKSLPFTITMLGIFLLITLLSFLKASILKKKLHEMMTSQWFFLKIFHSLSLTTSFILSLLLMTRTLDRGWQEQMGAQGSGYLSTKASQIYQTTQKGLMKSYMASSMMSFTLMMLLIFSISS